MMKETETATGGTTLKTVRDAPPQLRPRKRRRWLQFGLRSLLVLVVLCAVACSWMAVTMHRARKQREAVAAFRHFPGIINYDHKGGDPPGPAWLRRLVGDDAFAHVDFVCLGCNKEFTDDTLQHVRWLPRLRVLRLGGAGITDEGLRHVEGLTQLEMLSLHNTQITDAGLEHIERLPRLENLSLYRTRITDAALASLARMTTLQKLDLRRTRLSADAVEQLRQTLPGCGIRWEPPEPDEPER